MGSRPRPRLAGLHHATALFFLALFVLGAAGACTDILGINDRTLTSSGAGGSTTTGGGGTGGSTGGGGHAGSTTGGGGTGGIVNTCATDDDCVDSPFGGHCDPETHTCVECLPGPGDDCAVGLYCDVTKVCAVGCADDADCKPNGMGTLVCDPATHHCTGCGAGAPCPPGSKCDTDKMECVPGCDQTSDCPTADWACCNKQCKNVTKDVQNCGACEDPCVPAQSTTWICLDGGCVYQSCALGWDDCDKNVSKGNGCETDTQNDPKHCGDCKTMCAFANAVAGCAVGNCTIASCTGTFRNCDDKLMNGCETNITNDAKNCGDCGASCDGVFAHGDGICVASKCELGGCKPGYDDCDGNPDNGCETDLNADPQHCGSCGGACAIDHATAKCTLGACVIDTCDMPFQDCNAMVSDGCEANTKTDPAHCGSCPNACTYAHAAGICNMGGCSMGQCNSGYADCNGLTSDGCEVNLANDTNNCGACNSKCVANHGTASCMNQTCQFSCNGGFGNCDNDPSNGCETDLSNTVQHCGTCATVCSPVNGGTPYCFASVCGESNCPAGSANCDGNPNNGCEVDITTPNNCGSCGNHCSSTNGTPSCNGGSCAITCNQGYGNCNNNVSDGCEQPLNTNNHCTSCNAACLRDHAITSCGTGSCLIVSCDQGFADCNGNASDGCEANLATSTNNCGGCGNVCSPANGVGACVAGACTIQSCNTPFANCNGGVADGCEVNLNTDALHCGSCPNQCSFANATATCSGGQCQIGSCNFPFQNCNGMPGDGCEANLQTSTSNCGSCGNQCASINGNASCSNGSCSIVCDAAHKNCNGLFNDGCERSIRTLQDCGDCNVPCNLQHASESCATGTCQITSCDPGYTNCDGSAGNGCECGSVCNNMQCQGCGDGFCNGGETCVSCPGDCCSGGMCGDGFCSANESCGTCAIDCCPPCGDNICSGPTETCGSCPQDCCPPPCGDGICNGAAGENCGTCEQDCCPPCGDGICSMAESCGSCAQDCCPPMCGDGFCNGAAGETCGTCPNDCCSMCGDNICESPPEDCASCPSDCCPPCGDLICSGNETCGSCPQDCCPPSCGNGTCESASGETCGTCPQDCCMGCGDNICAFPQEDCGSCPQDCCPGSTSSSSSGGGGMDGGVGGMDGGSCPQHSGVQCGGPVCSASPGCCRSGPGIGMCVGPPTCPANNSYTCDDVSDCALGDVCCHPQGSGASCVPSGTCTGTKLELCTSPSAGAPSCECSGVQQCCPTGPKSTAYPTCQPQGVCL